MQCLSRRSGAIAVCHGICFAGYLRSDSFRVFLSAAFISKFACRALCLHTWLAQLSIFTTYRSKKYHASQERFRRSISQFQSADKNPHAVLVSARLRSHRLRYDFCCTLPRIFACPRKNLHCATWHMRALQVAPAWWHSQLRSSLHSSLRFKASASIVIAMNYCNHEELDAPLRAPLPHPTCQYN